MLSWAEWQQLGFDRLSVIADPKLEDGEDYRFSADSPVWTLGFKALPVEQMGPYPCRNRASWPIIQADGARERPLTSFG